MCHKLILLHQSITSDELLIVDQVVSDLALKIRSYYLLLWTTPGTNFYRLGSPDTDADICRSMACQILIRDPHLGREEKEEKLDRGKSPNAMQV